MKKLLNTLYVLSEDAYLALDGENVVVHRGNTIAGRIPLHTLCGINYFGYKGASPRLMGECATRCIDLSFFTPTGRFLTRVAHENTGNVLLRRAQYRIADDTERSCLIARNFITAKIFNARWILERAKRDHPLQIDSEKVCLRSRELTNLTDEALTAESIDTLRGIEGYAAKSYYAVFDELILDHREDFRFDGRNRRPPKDPVNAVLSFAYVLLANECASALEGIGLDPYVGFMHADRPGRKSLALDLVEELRPVVADRAVLMCINNRILNSSHFLYREDGSVYLSTEGRRAFLEVWQKRKKAELTHPYLKEKVSWGLVPHVQAMLLARCIRGDVDGYPPFMWK